MMHNIYVCEHNNIVLQCKCPGPHTRVEVPCADNCDKVFHEKIGHVDRRGEEWQ